ncbi:MAG: glycosyl transferase family 2, partial [Deltaproteobacteria bacterium]|nr:glycosyl transferase family 2 [Deltaproteobacteria bacterium]
PYEGVLIAGTGPTGRELARAFQERDVQLAGFFDNRLGPPERSVLGHPAWGFPEGVPFEFFEPFKQHLVVLGIGDKEGQTMMTRLLLENGWLENQHFVRMA